MPPSVADRRLITRVLNETQRDVAKALARRDEENRARLEAGRDAKGPVNEQLSFSIYFGRRFGAAIRQAFLPDFHADYLRSGEVGSASAEGEKRVDVSYSTPQGGLGFMVSLKSVHRGERNGGSARFTHNLKRNDEELRVEATALHVRQPYAVLVAVMVLPFEACDDGWQHGGSRLPTSSFARWVEKFWTLKGREEPEDPPHQFEAVFIALYARDGSALGFYEVGGAVPCPRVGPPAMMLTFNDFVSRVKATYRRRNQRDFHFDGEALRVDEAGAEDDAAS